MKYINLTIILLLLPIVLSIDAHDDSYYCSQNEILMVEYSNPYAKGRWACVNPYEMFCEENGNCILDTLVVNDVNITGNATIINLTVTNQYVNGTVDAFDYFINGTSIYNYFVPPDNATWVRDHQVYWNYTDMIISRLGINVGSLGSYYFNINGLTGNTPFRYKCGIAGPNWCNIEFDAPDTVDFSLCWQGASSNKFSLGLDSMEGVTPDALVFRSGCGALGIGGTNTLMYLTNTNITITDKIADFRVETNSTIEGLVEHWDDVSYLDDVKAIFGNSGDDSLTHNGSDMLFKNEVGSHNLYIKNYKNTTFNTDIFYNKANTNIYYGINAVIEGLNFIGTGSNANVVRFYSKSKANNFGFIVNDVNTALSSANGMIFSVVSGIISFSSKTKFTGTVNMTNKVQVDNALNITGHTYMLNDATLRGNISMRSDNGSIWNCGVNNTGVFKCT